MTTQKTPVEIAAMRTSGKLLATILKQLSERVEPGMTSKDLAAFAAAELKAAGGEPVFLGYQGFPDVICISVNEEVQHTIPRAREINTGDVVNFDFGVRYDGMVTDAGVTVGVGQITADAQRLIDGTRKALAKGIATVRDGSRVGDISAAVEACLLEHKLGIVKDLMGHGVGHDMHEEPGIPNFGRAGKGPVLKAGMTICIEPIANLGSGQIFIEDDDWTLVSRDGSWSSQFEHSILVTQDGAEILTLP
jgi:methionyl aminopeptidase